MLPRVVVGGDTAVLALQTLPECRDISIPAPVQRLHVRPYRGDCHGEADLPFNHSEGVDYVASERSYPGHLPHS